MQAHLHRTDMKRDVQGEDPLGASTRRCTASCRTAIRNDRSRNSEHHYDPRSVWLRWGGNDFARRGISSPAISYVKAKLTMRQRDILSLWTVTAQKGPWTRYTLVITLFFFYSNSYRGIFENSPWLSIAWRIHISSLLLVNGSRHNWSLCKFLCFIFS